MIVRAACRRSIASVSRGPHCEPRAPLSAAFRAPSSPFSSSAASSSSASSSKTRLASKVALQRDSRQRDPTEARRSASTLPFAQPAAPPPPPKPADGIASSSHLLTHPAIPDLEIVLQPGALIVTCPSRGVAEPFEIDHLWLRDTCPEVGTSIQKGTGQKLAGTSDVPIPGPEEDLLDPNHLPQIQKRGDGRLELVLTYSTAYPVFNAFSTTFSPVPPKASTTPHVSRLPVDIILAHASETGYRKYHFDPAGAARPWGASDLAEFPASELPPSRRGDVKPTSLDVEAAGAKPVRVDYASLIEGAADSLDTKWSLARGLIEEGLVFVKGVPTGVKSGTSLNRSPNDPELAHLAHILGEIRHTFYGPIWDVRSLPSSESKNIAYTNVDLGFHMDLLYYQTPPRFQFLHMLRNQVKGGQSLFVDAYKIAEHMWEHHRDMWTILTQVPVAYHYQNDSRYYRYSHPVFELPMEASGHSGPSFSHSTSEMPRLTAVNYSPPFQAPIPLPQHHLLSTSSPSTREFFYKSLAKFADLTLKAEFRYARQLNEGECVIFDNRRVLHSRLGFEFEEEEGNGKGKGEKSKGAAASATDEAKYKRWLKGAYVEGDAIWSTYRMGRARAEGKKEKDKSKEKL